jgi:methylated-DNA-[protein]-cysteine S-methyltransferase
LNKAIGGFKGEAQDAPSGINQKEKRKLLRGEGVEFDGKGLLVEKDRWWDDFKV